MSVQPWDKKTVGLRVKRKAYHLAGLMAAQKEYKSAAYSASYLVASLEHRTAALKADHLEAKMAVMKGAWWVETKAA